MILCVIIFPSVQVKEVTKSPWQTNSLPIRPGARQQAPQAPEVTGLGGPEVTPPPMIREQEPGPLPEVTAEVILERGPRPWEVMAPRPQGPEVMAQHLLAQAAATTLPRPPQAEAVMVEVMAAVAAQEEVMEDQEAEVEAVMAVEEEEATEGDEIVVTATEDAMGVEEAEEVMVEGAVALEVEEEGEEVLEAVAEMKKFSQTTKSSSRDSQLTLPLRILLNSLAQ